MCRGIGALLYYFLNFFVYRWKQRRYSQLVYIAVFYLVKEPGNSLSYSRRTAR